MNIIQQIMERISWVNPQLERRGQFLLVRPTYHNILIYDENHTELASPVLLDLSDAYQGVLMLCLML